MLKPILTALAAFALSTGAALSDPVYLLAQSEVTDAETFFEQYGPAAFATLQEHGATVHFGAQSHQAIEGDWTGNWTALVSFPSEAAAMDWYHSPAYAAARPLRLAASAEGRLILFRPVADE